MLSSGYDKGRLTMTSSKQVRGQSLGERDALRHVLNELHVNIQLESLVL